MLIKKKFDCKCSFFQQSIKEHGHLHAGNRPGKAVEGGIHRYVESLYQVPPNKTYQVCLIKQMSLGSHVAI